MLNMLGKKSADDILKYFSKKKCFYILYKLSSLETVSMKCQRLFSWKKKKKKKKNIINVSCIEFAQRVVEINDF